MFTATTEDMRKVALDGRGSWWSLRAMLGALNNDYGVPGWIGHGITWQRYAARKLLSAAMNGAGTMRAYHGQAYIAAISRPDGTFEGFVVRVLRD